MMRHSDAAVSMPSWPLAAGLERDPRAPFPVAEREDPPEGDTALRARALAERSRRSCTCRPSSAASPTSMPAASATNAAACSAGPRTPDHPTGCTCRWATMARASTVVVSGSDVIRPMGHQAPEEGSALRAKRLIRTGTGRPDRTASAGKRLGTAGPCRHLRLRAAEHWSARDIRPGVPAAGTLPGQGLPRRSAWIVTQEALEPFAWTRARSRCSTTWEEAPYNFDIS